MEPTGTLVPAKHFLFLTVGEDVIPISPSWVDLAEIFAFSAVA